MDKKAVALSYTFWTLPNPVGRISPGSFCVISGKAEVWRYCEAVQQAIDEGASVVAVGDGTDMIKNYGPAVVVYSNNREYRIGETLSEGESQRSIRAPERYPPEAEADGLQPVKVSDNDELDFGDHLDLPPIPEEDWNDYVENEYEPLISYLEQHYEMHPRS